GSSLDERPFVDEQHAIVLLKNGNLDGLEELVNRYQQQAVRAACLITADRAQAEDIVQTAFIRITDKINQFDPARPFGPWFLRIVVNDAIKYAQRINKLTALDENEQYTVAQLIDPAALPEEQVENLELRQNVWSALQKLSPRQRAAIVMRYYLGLHEDEMAKELDGPVGTIKWLLYAARERLVFLLAGFRPADEKITASSQRKNNSTRSGGSK
ncbi:MAG: sigma-70 family RNA polymerase sigma factor, partial [Anaerolineae bacterium]|nr:sigma-70 family RNA polymerase sigma factor [Anaerolineae bacterium]